MLDMQGSMILRAEISLYVFRTLAVVALHEKQQKQLEGEIFEPTSRVYEPGEERILTLLLHERES